METAYLHLVTNHIPIIGVPFAIALLALGIWRKSDELKTASFLAFVIIGIATIGVYLLGQGGEDFIEDLPGVSHDAIEDHEQIATLALASMLILTAVSAWALIRYRLFRRRDLDELDKTTVRPSFPTWTAILVLGFAVASAGVLGYTGRLGGKIRHPEFHGGIQAANGETDESAAEEETDEKGRGRKRNRGGR